MKLRKPFEIRQACKTANLIPLMPFLQVIAYLVRGNRYSVDGEQRHAVGRSYVAPLMSNVRKTSPKGLVVRVQQSQIIITKRIKRA